MRSAGQKSTSENGASRYRAFVRKRTTWLFLFYALAFAAIAVRLVYIQAFQSGKYIKWADTFRSRPLIIPASRGSIFDRNGRALAMNIDTVSVFANIREMNGNYKSVSQKLAPILGKDAASIEEKFQGKDNFLYLARRVDERIGQAIRRNRKELPGIGYEADTSRAYPAGPLAAQVLGFTNIDNRGVEGLERACDGDLVGTPGKEWAELDSARRPIPQTRRIIKNSIDGKDIYLTIDETIQHITEQALTSMTKTYTPERACAIVMDPGTGEILALANYPTFDPNKARAAKPELWRNRAVADLYEPGSTLKVVTVAAGVNEGIDPHTPMTYCTGREKMQGGRIPCVLHAPFLSGHGAADMYRIIEYSCNIGAAHVGLKVGGVKLRYYLSAFGLTSKCAAGFRCEASGLPFSEDEWQRPIKVANAGFGQGVAVTPLGMASVYATIANGGIRMQPTVIREIRDKNGKVIQPFRARGLGRVIRKQTADELTKMLMKCVEDGTGKPAQVDGRTIAGKTGSAQVPRMDGHGYEAGAYVASFMGFAPASKPRLTIAVVVFKPKTSHWGATVAAPVFKEIAEKSLWYLKVPADAPVKPNTKRKPKALGKNIA